MNGSVAVAKGRVKEAAGALAKYDKRRARGQTNQPMGCVEQAAEFGVRQAYMRHMAQTAQPVAAKRLFELFAQQENRRIEAKESER